MMDTIDGKDTLHATRICKMTLTKMNLMTWLLLPVSEVVEKDDSLMGNNGKLTISRYRKLGLTYQHQTRIKKQKTLKNSV